MSKRICAWLLCHGWLYRPSLSTSFRSDNRQICFCAEEDHRCYLSCLGASARKYQVPVHAYVLTTNHVHLLLTPALITGITRVTQTPDRGYVRYINRIRHRSGHLWEGRDRTSRQSEL